MRLLLSIIVCVFSLSAFCQPTWTLDPFGKEKKPEKYEEKMLGSEKTATKKFTKFRHFVQNNVTHYNYYFNANNKLNAVIERAKMAQKDDYSALLSFYPYSFENTSSQKVELDSVIYKSSGGILLHDLRNDWIDDLYFLIGKAYYLRNDLDSAALTFQFINYNLFPRKKQDGDDNKVIGGNYESAGTGGKLTIADKEDRNFIQKTLTKAPVRNESLIWLTRTLIDKKEFGDAAGMLNILHNDPNLPKRLVKDLNEVTSYWFYSQNIYDSSAVYLERALGNAEDKQDLARWEYLLAQMLEMNGQYAKASEYYAKAAKHTVDPLLDIHAHLNDAKMARNSGDAKELDNNIERLKKMAKKDKYEGYRDIIYYSIAQLNLQRPDTTSGITYYVKSTQNAETGTYKDKSFLQLGNIAYQQRDYLKAFAWYDSLMPSADKMQADFNIKERRDGLLKIVEHVKIIEREDSLQRIAAMPEAERDAYLKKLSRALRKAAGLKEDDSSVPGNNTGFTSKNEPADLFAPTKGDWYFYNAGLKSKGFSEFKSKWGKRNNIDNWRRASAATAAQQGNTFGDPLDAQKTAAQSADSSGGLVENSFDALLFNLPLTTTAMDSSNGKIAESMLALAKIFQFDLQDHEEAIRTLENYLERFPDRLQKGDVYLALYYSYSKLGNQAKADYYKNLVITKFNNAPAGIKLTNPEYLRPDLKNPEVTARYEKIYDLFIEGNFEQALQLKQAEDSTYGDTYWTPQLSYIEAIYHIRQRNDSMAIVHLTRVSDISTDQRLKDKAETLISVLSRRKEIEEYLTKLEVTRVEEEKLLMPTEDNAAPILSKPTEEKKIIAPVMPNRPVIRDTLTSLPGMAKGSFRLQPDQPHFVVMLLDKVDPVYVGEAKNAFERYNRQFYGKNYKIARESIDSDKQLLLISPFEDAEQAMQYFDKIKKAAPAEVSWLPASKYSFLIITADNLQLLKDNKELNTYKELLNNHYGNKF